MDTFGDDLRHALRALRQSPVVTLAVVLSLALGIGANSTVFTWVRAVLLQPLPGVAHAGRVLSLETSDPDEGLVSWSHPDYLDLRDNATTLDGAVAFDDEALSLATGGQAERVWSLLVSGNYFDVLGVRPLLGRALRPSDDAPGAPAVLVIGERLWTSRFGADPGLVGRAVELNRQPFQVVGVMPAEFVGTRPGLIFDAWVPLASQALLAGGNERLSRRGDRFLQVLGRARDGVALGQVQAELDGLGRALAHAHPETNARHGFTALPMWKAPRSAARTLGPVLIVLMSVVGLVLLIACANVANLLLARATGRRREMAVRVSLGASRGRLLRLLLAESLVLALLGGAGGILVASWTSGVLVAFVPPSDFPVGLALQVDGRTLGFTALVSLGVALLCGLGPALRAAGVDPSPGLRENASGFSLTRRRARLSRALVGFQVALSLLLLVAAGLLIRSLGAARAAHPGFDAKGVLVASFDLVQSGYTPREARAFLLRLIESVGALPGVEAVSLGRRIPLGLGGSSSTRGMQVEGYVPPANEALWAYSNVVGPAYFATLRIPLEGGRDFTSADTEGAPPVVVINQTMARRYWPGREAVGGRIEIGGRWCSVVGVARDSKLRQLQEPPAPAFYLPVLQVERPPQLALFVRGGDAAAQAQALRARVAQLDPRLPLFGLRSLEAHASAATIQPRLASSLLGALGALALVLTAVGLYGLLSYRVGQRRREIGIRAALGARRAETFALVLREGLATVAVGTLVGLALAALAARALRGLLFGVSPADPLTYAAVAGVLGSVALLACALPARRALRVEPLEVLRCE